MPLAGPDIANRIDNDGSGNKMQFELRALIIRNMVEVCVLIGNNY